jgi:hypothetical protein
MKGNTLYPSVSNKIRGIALFFIVKDSAVAGEEAGMTRPCAVLGLQSPPDPGIGSYPASQQRFTSG